VKLLTELLLLIVSATAATQAPPAVTDDAGQKAEVTAGSVVLADGTSVILRNIDPLYSNVNHVGDVIKFEVAKPLTAGGLIVIARGAPVTAHVTVAEPAHRKGKGGRLELVFDSVELVNGQMVPVRATVSQQAGGQRDMAANMIGAGLLTAGLASPLFLFQKGSELEIRRGERFVALLNGEVKLARADVEVHQPKTLRPRGDIAVLYVIKAPMKGELVAISGSEIAWRFAIGVQTYQLSPNSALRIEVPPGKYWLHASGKELKNVKPDELASVEAKAGESYYFQYVLGDRAFILKSVDSEAAEKLITDAEVFVTLPIEQMKPDELQYLQLQPPQK
jgi:hypothetical protein